jgi:hypothetical protein
VTDAEIAQPAGLPGVVKGVRQPQVGVADHAEDGVDAPIDHRLYHLVHERRLVHRLVYADVDSVVAHLDRISFDGRIVIFGWGDTAMWIVLPAVPGTDDAAFFQDAIAQRPALVRAAVVDGSVSLLGSGQANGVVAGLHGGNAADFEQIGRTNAKPASLVILIVTHCSVLL